MSADDKEIDYFEPDYEITDLGIIHYLVPHYKEDDIKYNIEPTYLVDNIPYKAEREDEYVKQSQNVEATLQST